MLLHVVGGDEVAADIADLLELLFLVSALVDEVHVLHVHLLLFEHLLARVEAAHVVAPRIPKQKRGFNEAKCFKLDSGLN
jgi:hypothetical protein